MPRYFFDVANGDKDTDDEGIALDDDAAARCEAIRYAGATIADQPDLLLAAPHLDVTARDADGRIIVRVLIRIDPAD